MIGANIRLLRQANGLSLQELSDRLSANRNISATKATISNYETGKSIPGAEFLSILAAELQVPPTFFAEDINYRADFCYFNNISRLIARQRQELAAFLSLEIGRCIHIDQLLQIAPGWQQPRKRRLKVGQQQEIEEITAALRLEMGIRSQPIASVCTLLENNGWYLFYVPDFCPLDKLAGLDRYYHVPFILFRPGAFLDELRLHLLESVGYAYIEGDTPEQTETLVQCFARAMLLPRELAVKEFGTGRTTIAPFELTAGKQKLGLGKRYIVQRLYELGIVRQEFYTEYTSYLSQHRYLTQEGGLFDDIHFFEAPTSYEMRLARAGCEGLTTQFNRLYG